MQPKAPGFWKFNNSLLDDEDFTSAIRESLPDFKDKYADLDDLGLKWDLIKMDIRGFTIKYSKQCRSRVKIIGGAHHERQSHEVLGSPGECSSGKFLYRGSLK